MSSIRTWKQRTGIQIDEVEFDGDRHAFEIYVDGKNVVTICADSPEQTEDMRSSLDAGEDVRDWENVNGHCVGMLIRQRTGDGLRETLKRIEDAGTCYNGDLCSGKFGTYWVDNSTGTLYEYDTEVMDLSVDDLTDEDLKNVMIGGL